jgi:hypothetical protein
MTVSAFRARYFSRFFYFACMLYLSPFCSSAVSLLVNWMSGLFMILGWNVCFFLGVIVCVLANLVSFLSNVLYLICVSFCSFSSIVCWMYSQVLFQVLARCKV